MISVKVIMVVMMVILINLDIVIGILAWILVVIVIAVVGGSTLTPETSTSIGKSSIKRSHT